MKDLEPFLHVTVIPVTNQILVNINTKNMPEEWGNDPFVIGIVLVDLARHFSKIYEDDEEKDVLPRIYEGFDAERAHFTSDLEELELA